MNILLVAGVGVGGVLLGYLVGFLLGSWKGRQLERARLNEAEGVLCYQCRSRVDPEWIVEDDDGGFPVCPVCHENMLPPVGRGADPRGAGAEVA